MGLAPAIDQGTTGTTVLVVDQNMTVRARGYREFAQIYPRPGRGRARPRGDLGLGRPARWRRRWRTSTPARIAAIGITNQRETTLLWERETGRPVANAIVWQDRRTSDACAALKAAGHEALVRERTGLVLDPYFSATKIRWLLDNVTGLRRRAEAGGDRLRHRRQLPDLAAVGRARARHRRDQRLAHAAVRPARRGASPTTCASCSACRARCCPRCAAPPAWWR